MKKRINRILITFAMVFALFSASACGNKPSADTFSNETETEESTIEERETIESEEETAENEEAEEPIQTASGHQHNIDIEEKMKETNAEEEVLDEEREEEVQTETTTTAVEKQETEVATSVTETTTTPTATVNTVPETITMDPNFVKCSMYVVYDTQVKDAPYAASGNQGLITRGSNIGVMERCIETGYYRVNYGAKAAYLPGDALSAQDPFAH